MYPQERRISFSDSLSADTLVIYHIKLNRNKMCASIY